MQHFLLLSFLATVVFAQSSLRVVPEGTRLENGLVTPIYLTGYTAPQKEDPGNPRDRGKNQAHLQLKDAQSVKVDLYVKRGIETDLDGSETPTLQLFLNRPDGATGAREIPAQSEQERAYLLTLRVAEETYTPGWVTNWSIENHRALRQLIEDLVARNP